MSVYYSAQRGIYDAIKLTSIAQYLSTPGALKLNCVVQRTLWADLLSQIHQSPSMPCPVKIIFTDTAINCQHPPYFSGINYYHLLINQVSNEEKWKPLKNNQAGGRKGLAIKKTRIELRELRVRLDPFSLMKYFTKH